MDEDEPPNGSGTDVDEDDDPSKGLGMDDEEPSNGNGMDDVIAGTATAAIGWAALVADELDLPFIYVRSKPKEHGTQKRIEGFLKPDQHVVLIEDLISTAGSSISSVEALRTEGKAVVTDIVAIFSYELPAALEKAGEANVQLHPLSTFTALINLACDNGEITPDQFALMKRFAKDPEAWGRAL
jgi:orotate phosphoribosyltransferase